MNLTKELLDTSLSDTRIHTAAPELWKRALDLTCILAALPALVVIMVFIAIMIKVVSRGPVFFRQPRVGYKGKSFECFKFRSMRVNADTKVHQQHLAQLIKADCPMVKMDAGGDSRLIPFGSLMRASGLDELPQLINVVRGEMSIVGPRPCTPYEYDQYQSWHKQRFDTLPGLTGLWQVSGKNQTTFSQMMKLDIHYARHKSLMLDLKIMFRTFSTLAKQLKEVRTNGKGCR